MEFKEMLKKALFYNDYDRVKALVESKQFSSSLLVDCGDFSDINVPTPIYYISQLWNEILPGNWPLCQDAVDRQLESLNKILTYLESTFQVPASNLLDLSKYSRYTTGYNLPYGVDCDSCTVKDLLWETREELNAKGFRDLDIDLYCATKKCDFVEVERLLQLGAIDTVCFDEGDDESSTYAQVCDDFSERDDWQAPTLYPNSDYDARKFDMIMIHSMFGSAAKHRMRKLLNKYYKEPET